MNEFQQINPRNKNLNALLSVMMERAAAEIRFTAQNGPRSVRVGPGEMVPRGPVLEIADDVPEDAQVRRYAIIDSNVVAVLAGPGGLGFNLMRFGLGSTDWNRDWDFYTYCDLPPGKRPGAGALFGAARH